MTAHQPTLFPLPRHLEPGEPPCCAICARHDASGTYGPPGLESLTLEDRGRWVEHTVRLQDVWLCAPCAKVRWDDWRDAQVKVPARLRRLAAFRHVDRPGLSQRELFAQAEALLAAGWQPPAKEGA